MWQVDPTTLKLFIAVCEEGSIAAAAEREFIVASAVSKRISDIEKDIGISLLRRSKQGASPTPAGQALLRHARLMMRNFEKLQVEMSEFTEGVRGLVQVMANMSSIVEFLPEEISAFLLANEHIRVDLAERLSPDVVRAVAEGHADIGICRRPAQPGELEVIPYRKDSLALLVNAQHPLADRAFLSFAESLDYEHLSLSAYAKLVESMHRTARTVGKELRVKSHVSSFDATYRLVQAGLGVAVLPIEAVQRYTALFDLRAVPLVDDWATGEFVICVREADSLSLASKRLLNHLLARAPSA